MNWRRGVLIQNRAANLVKPWRTTRLGFRSSSSPGLDSEWLPDLRGRSAALPCPILARRDIVRRHAKEMGRRPDAALLLPHREDVCGLDQGSTGTVHPESRARRAPVLYPRRACQDLPWLDDRVRARARTPIRRHDRDEILAVLQHLDDIPPPGAGPIRRRPGACQKAPAAPHGTWRNDIRTAQSPSVHRDVATTMIDMHVLNVAPQPVQPCRPRSQGADEPMDPTPSRYHPCRATRRARAGLARRSGIDSRPARARHREMIGAVPDTSRLVLARAARGRRRATQLRRIGSYAERSSARQS